MSSIVLEVTAAALVYFTRSVTRTLTLMTPSGAEPLSKVLEPPSALEMPLHCMVPYEHLTTQERTVILYLLPGNGI